LNNKQLQNFLLKNRISINEIFNKTGIPANRMRGYLAGRITIPDYVSDRIKQLGENNDD